MRIGVTFPQADLELDAIQTRDFAQAVEEMGFDHLLCYDHVLGAGRRTRPDWTAIHDEDHRFHEVLVLFGYLAAVTGRSSSRPASSACRSARRRSSQSRPPRSTS